jgi:chromosome segregation ATPase
MDVGPTPALPTLALPPMPEPPKSGSIVEAVKYLLPLGKAMWARKKAQDGIRELLHGDQRLLDSVLRDLGRVAREADLEVPALADEMGRVKEQEARRTAAEERVTEAETAAKREDERWHIDQGERQADLARREAEIKATDEELRLKAEQRRLHDAERAKVDAQIRAAEKRAAAADAKAQKAEITAPEKGGGPNTAANARAEAAEARKEATALIPSRDAARAEVEKLDAPIAELTQKLTDGRAALVQKRKELGEAKVAHEHALAELQGTREQAGQDRDAAERELTQRFVTAGTILNLNRVEHPKLAPLFARVDELKNGVNAREAAIIRLEGERRLYDRAAVQKGLIVLGSAVGVVVILAIILIVLLSR